MRHIGDRQHWDISKRRDFQNDALIALTARRHAVNGCYNKYFGFRAAPRITWDRNFPCQVNRHLPKDDSLVGIAPVFAPRDSPPCNCFAVFPDLAHSALTVAITEGSHCPVPSPFAAGIVVTRSITIRYSTSLPLHVGGYPLYQGPFSRANF